MDYKNLIAGTWSETSDSCANVNPSDVSDILGHAAVGSTQDMDRAIAAAKQAAPTWAATTPQKRFDVLDRGAGHNKSERMDRVARVRRQNNVSRRSQCLSEVCEPFFRSHGRDDFAIRIKCYAETTAVVVCQRPT